MYKAQYKLRSPVTPWMTLGMYATEADAIASAIRKKKSGALVVRVITKNSDLVYIS